MTDNNDAIKFDIFVSHKHLVSMTEPDKMFILQHMERWFFEHGYSAAITYQTMNFEKEMIKPLRLEN